MVQDQTNSGNIVFLSVPESLRGKLEAMPHEGHNHSDEHEEFSIDPAVPLPVELSPGQTRLDLEELSWEMILSGMIRVVSAKDDPGLAGAVNAQKISRPLDEVIDYYRHFVLAVKPDIFNEFNEAAILKARNGDYIMALEIMDALKGLLPLSPVVLLNRALILGEQAEALERSGQEAEAQAADGGVYDRASAAYEEALALTPPFSDAFFNAGFFFMKRRNFQQARNCFSRYLSISEEAAESADQDIEKQEQAEKLIREIESQGLEDDHFQEAYDYIRSGELQPGLEEIRNFLEAHPNAWNGWFLLGWGLRKLSRWEDAAAAFRKTIELGGDNSDTLNELAICLMEMDDFSGARKALETALREEPESVKIISNLGILALKKGNNDEAAAFFRTVLALEPEDPVANEFFGTKA